MSVTDFISHFGVAAGMGWLKATAPLNMFEVLVKAVVSQFLMVSLPPLLNALAPWNMAFMSFTATVSQTGDVPGVSSWLNVSAFRNISCMSVTNFVSQVFRGWSKAFAPLNIRTMSFTLSVFHLLPLVGIALLNAAAPLNMFFIVVTLAVFHRSTSPLNFEAPSNILSMVVTSAVFHLSPLVLIV